MEAAVNAYEQAISHRSNFPEAFNNMGLAFKQHGNFEVAIEAFKKAITIQQNYIIAWNNLGLVYFLDNQLDSSIIAYQKSLTFDPTQHETYHNLAIALHERGKLTVALDVCKAGLITSPGNLKFLRLAASLLRRVIFTVPSQEYQDIILEILEHKTLVRPNEISQAAISLLKLDPLFKDFFISGKPNESEVNDIDESLRFVKSPLLQKLMELCPINDPQLESIIVKLRAHILYELVNNPSKTDLTNFQISLSLQCFTNEYVYFESDSETKAILNLELDIESILHSNKQPTSSQILCLASYRPLGEYKWHELLKDTIDIEAVFLQQIIEPKREQKLKSTIRTQDEITDNVSIKVKGQYETNPYPRWTVARIFREAQHVSKNFEELQLRADMERLRYLKKPRILVAGCGTGRHPIESATNYKDAEILAIDLSLSSLAYAKRKAEEFAIKNIEFMQLDILNLKKLGRKFDIIESSGVVHHMANPIQGWRILHDCLENHGVLLMGLYSALSRENIRKIREETIRLGFSPDTQSMRKFRKFVQESNEGIYESIRHSDDFCTLSSIRDLVFHEQEHHFTIPQIQDILDELKLRFCGFTGEKVLSAFRSSFPQNEAIYDLQKWSDFENENPDIFDEMYQFWCQKIS